MNIKKAIKDLLFFGSVYYTVMTVAILIIASLVSESNGVKVVETDQFLKILLFSFVMSLGSTLLRVESIPRTVAVIIHAACYIVGFLVFIILCGANFTLTAIFTAIFALVYVIITVVNNIISKKLKKTSSHAKIEARPAKKRKVKEEYSSQFKKIRTQNEKNTH